MKHPSCSIFSTRWLLPVAISLLAVAVLRQKSDTPLFFSRYSGELVLLFLLILCWAFVTWWIAINDRRSERLFSRMRNISIGLPVILIVVSLLILDLLTPVGDILISILSQHFLLLSSLGILLIMLVMIILSAKHPRNALQNLTLLLVSTTMALFVAEMVFRLVLVEYHVPHTEAGFEKLIASSWPHPVSIDKPAGMFRILGLSDSFGTNGDERNYHYLLEAMLQQKDPNYEIVNLSRGAYELPEERELFLRFGPRYQPDLVLHGVFVGNDFWGNPEITLLKYRDISLSLNKGIASWRPKNFLLRQWITNYFIILRNERKKQVEQASGKSVGEMSHSEFLRVERQRLDICHKSLTSDVKIWDTVSFLLDQIHTEATRIGARYVIVIHPDQFQVERGLIQELEQTYAFNPVLYDFEQPQRFLLGYCRSRGIPCLDLLPVFREKGIQGGLYLLRNTHYNEQGNQLAADTIVQFLKNNNLLE